jgi:glucoamylase
LLGTTEHGRWLIAPEREPFSVSRAYRDGSTILETVFTTAEGEVALIDFMPVGQRHPSVTRIVEGRRGRPRLRMELILRFDYGATVPWVTRTQQGNGIVAIAGPDLVVLHCSVPLEGAHLATTAAFAVAPGERAWFILTHAPSHAHPPRALDPFAALRETERFWTNWSGRGRYGERYADAVKRSVVTLKALTFAPTGGIAAAVTTSLPEQLGGSRNWDYRYCWLRDATLTLLAFMRAGLFEEARAWRDWLHRSIAGSPDKLRIMYGLSGERRLSEWEADWLPGYQGARPVRIGNAAADQLQLDVYGEVMDTLYQARAGGLGAGAGSWALETALVEHLETIWEQPDEGIWETRGGRQQFTFSKAMAWVALDRAIRGAESFGLEAPLDRWRALRETMHARVCREGYSERRGGFVSVFGGDALDASLLLLPLAGFLPARDPRIIGTVAAIERELMADGFVLRYDAGLSPDGLPPGEGAFLACSFWLADNFALQGRRDEATALFERLLALRNDVGLLSEEYDPRARRLVGNFPQAFSHVALIGSARTLEDGGPARERATA